VKEQMKTTKRGKQILLKVGGKKVENEIQGRIQGGGWIGWPAIPSLGSFKLEIKKGNRAIN